jgi:Flp pilus assembly protein TadG
MNRPSERRPAKDQRPKQRRGVTLVLVAVLFTALMGFVAMAVDFGRMYVFKAELKRAADAVAISVVLDKSKGRNVSTIVTNGTPVLNANKIERNSVATVDLDAFDWINYNFATRAVTSGTWENSNGARIPVQYTANWTFLRVVGSTSRVLNEVSVAAFGSLSSSNCLRPFALPYKSLLAQLSPPRTDVGSALTDTDVLQLSGPHAETQFIDNGTADGVSGGFGWVDVDATTTSGNPNAEIAAALAGCASKGVSVGSWLRGTTGAHAAVQPEIDQLCGAVLPGGPNPSIACTTPVILVPIYDIGNGLSGGNAQFRIKYIGAFKLTKQDKDGIWGYLTSLTVAPSGTLSNAAGPVMSVVLVQ